VKPVKPLPINPKIFLPLICISPQRLPLGLMPYDVAARAGLIGCIKGAPRSPTDLSTNPKQMERFGRE
jgi:hypothetical protein